MSHGFKSSLLVKLYIHCGSKIKKKLKRIVVVKVSNSSLLLKENVGYFFFVVSFLYVSLIILKAL